MKFYVIYSVDTCRDVSLNQYRTRGKAWQITEGDSCYEYDYLGGSWKGGKHRKYVAELTRKEFEQWLDSRSLRPEECETLGSLTDVGWMPAISFNEYAYDAIVNAYVTPIPQVPYRNLRQWQRMRDAVVNYYSK